MSKERTDKGRALEQAVKFIQETILKSSPEFKGTTFTIDTNVRDRSSGVLHEIDVLVKTHLNTDYEATWIFECKNWSKPVGKNEVIVLAEKVEALKANKGFLVAKRITSEAQTQLEKQKRLQFIPCSEDFLSPLNNVEIIHRVTELLPIVVQIKDRNRPPSPSPEPLNYKEFACRLNGQPVDFSSYIQPHINEMIHEDEQKNRSKYLNIGTHWGNTALKMEYSPGELMVGQIDVEYTVVPLYFFVETRRKKLLSKFEFEGRGRAYLFEPIESATNGKVWEIHMVQKL